MRFNLAVSSAVLAATSSSSSTTTSTAHSFVKSEEISQQSHQSRQHRQLSDILERRQQHASSSSIGSRGQRTKKRNRRRRQQRRRQMIQTAIQRNNDDVSNHNDDYTEGSEITPRMTVQPARSKRLTNVHSDLPRVCDPSKTGNAGSSNREISNADIDKNMVKNDYDDGSFLGILDCGEGQYCLEIDDGQNTRGICVNVQDNHQETKAFLDWEDASFNDDDGRGFTRLLQDVSLGVDLVSRLCENETEPLPPGETPSPCNCDNIDYEDFTGNIQCTFPPSECLPVSDACGNPAQRCYGLTYDIDIESTSSYTFEFCYVYTSPVEMTACYSEQFAYDDTNRVTEVISKSCELSLDGTTCNSCVLFDRPPASDADTDPITCLDIDCSNAVAGGISGFDQVFAGTVCEDESPDLFLDLVSEKVLIYDVLPCDGGCNLCGEDGAYMANPNVILSLPGTFDEYECGFLQVAALSGGFANITDYDVCGLLSPVVRVPCQCLDKDGNEILPLTPSPTITESPSAPPVLFDNPPSRASTFSFCRWTEGHMIRLSSIAVVATGIMYMIVV